MGERYNETILNLVHEVEGQISINNDLSEELKERLKTLQKQNKEKQAKIKQLMSLLEE